MRPSLTRLQSSRLSWTRDLPHLLLPTAIALHLLVPLRTPPTQQKHCTDADHLPSPNVSLVRARISSDLLNKASEHTIKTTRVVDLGVYFDIVYGDFEGLH